MKIILKISIFLIGFYTFNNIFSLPNQFYAYKYSGLSPKNIIIKHADIDVKQGARMGETRDIFNI